MSNRPLTADEALTAVCRVGNELWIVQRTLRDAADQEEKDGEPDRATLAAAITLLDLSERALWRIRMNLRRQLEEDDHGN